MPFTDPPALWRRQVEALVPYQIDDRRRPPAEGYVPFGLQFRVDGMTAALAPGSPPVPSSNLALSVRPVYQSQSGKWKSDYRLSWHGPGHFSGIDADPRLIDWLRDLTDLNADIKQYWYGNDASWRRLDAFAEAALWPTLRDGLALGVALVGVTSKDTVTLAARADVQANLTAGPNGSLDLTRLIVFDGLPARPTLFGAVGHTGLFAVEIGQDDRHLRLGPSANRLTDDQRRLLSTPTIKVPPDDVPDFMARFYPAVRRRLPVTSLDDSVNLPDLVKPVLRATVKARSARDLTIWWNWVYGDASYPFGPDAPLSGARDEAAESTILEAAEQAVRSLPELDSFRLRAQQSISGVFGLEAMAFVRSALPLLEQVPGIDVKIDGPLPSYQPMAEAPQIKVSATETNDNDWFDLGIEITAGGVPVPFLDVFVALSAGQTQMVLAGGQVVSIDLPELERLRALIADAAALADRPSAGLRISRYQSGLWSDLVELASDVVQAETWRQSVSDLIQLINTGQAVAPYDLPAGLEANLRPYQKHAYDWLTFLDEHRLGGILADDMGLGKTLEVLAWVLGVVQRQHPDSPFLVVAPASVVGNWHAEATRFAPSLRVVAVDETLKKAGRTVAELVAEVDVVVMSYAIYRLDYDELSTITWRGLVLDEAQFVKNARTTGNHLARTLSADVKIAVTGTPLENDIMELWALLSIVAPGFGGQSHQFKQLYGRPISQAALAQQRRQFLQSRGMAPVLGDDEAIAIGERRLGELRRRLRPLLLRRTKELVAPELPSRLEQVIEVDLAPRHRAIYDTYLQRERQRVLGLLSDLEKNRFAILRSLMVLRRLALDASLIEPEKYASVPSAKLDTLMEQLDEVVAGGHRALVFSQFTTFLTKVTQRLKRAGIDFAYLDGHTRNRAGVIQRFREQDVPVFCLSLKAGGFGLTLTEADYVFLLDPWWNPATEQQAIDRTHRIGQTRNVMVIRPVATGTIEDKVMALQARKRQVFKAVLADDAGETSFAAALSVEDISALLID